MSDEQEPKYREWRKDVERWRQQGEALEAIAAKYPDIPFEVQPLSNKLSWGKFDEDIHAFSARVRRIIATFGSPTEGPHQSGVNGPDSPGDLRTRWTLGTGAEIEVMAYMPNCRIKPGSTYQPFVCVPGRAPAIHPECQAVLDELADLEPETVEAV